MAGPSAPEGPKGPEVKGGIVAYAVQKAAEIKNRALNSVTKHKDTLMRIFGGNKLSENDQQSRRKLLRTGLVLGGAAAASAYLGPEAGNLLSQLGTQGESPKSPESVSGSAMEQSANIPEKPTEKDLQIIQEQLNDFLQPQVASELLSYLKFSDQPDRLLEVTRTTPEVTYTLLTRSISEVDNEDHQFRPFSLQITKDNQGNIVKSALNYNTISNGQPVFSSPENYPNLDRHAMELIADKSFREALPPKTDFIPPNADVPSSVYFSADDSVGEGSNQLFRRTGYSVNAGGEVKIVAEFSKNPFEPKEETLEPRKTTPEDIIKVQTTLKKYIRPDADPAFAAYIDSLASEPKPWMYTSTSSNKTEYNIRMGGSGVRVIINKDGSESIIGFVFKGGKIIPGQPSDMSIELPDEERKQIGDRVFVFAPNESPSERWKQGIGPDGKTPVLEAHTVLGNADVKYSIDNRGTYYIKSVSKSGGGTNMIPDKKLNKLGLA